MLGSGAGSGKSVNIKKIVKNGLQAWYKADRIQAPLGEEEIIDGDFSPTSSNAPNFNAWSKDDNWTISGGYATSDGSIAGNLDQTVLIVGRDYEVTLDVSNMTTSTLSVRLGGTNQVGSISGNGTYTFRGTADGAVFRIRSLADFDGSVDNISVRELVNSVKDSSINNNNGVLYSGKALGFDGSDQKIDFGNPGYSMKTLAFWINLDSTTEKVLQLTSSQSVEVSSGTITLNGTWTGSNIYVNTIATSTISASSWNRVVITITSAITVDDLELGNISTDFGDFDMADLQIYDSTWSVSDVAYDYSNPDKDVFDNVSSSILNTNCLALYRLNEGAGDRVYNAAPVLGAELVSNGDFTTDSDWTIEAVWTITGGAANGNGANGSSQQLIQSSVFTVGKTYKVTYDITNYVSGSVFMPNVGSSNSGNGTYSEFIAATQGDFKITGTNFDGSIDNISVKEISLSKSYAQANFDDGWVTAQPYIPQYAMSSYSKKMIFDSVDDVVSCGSDSSIDDIFSGGGSWSVWISAESRGANSGASSAGYIISKGAHLRTSTGSGPNDDANDVTIVFYYPWSGATQARWSIPATDVLKNNINHLVVTYDSSGVSNNPKIYVNGISANVTRVAVPAGIANSDATSDFIIGAQNSVGSSAYDGFIDEVSVWDKELSAAEVQEIFNSGIALDCRDHSAYLGSELVTDTDLNDETYWTAGDTYTAGTIVFSDDGLKIDSSKNVTGNDDGTEHVHRASLGTSQHDIVSITYTITDYVSGQFRAYIGDSSGSTAVSGNGTYTFTDTADTSQVLYLQSKDNFIGTISSISVKKVDLRAYWRNNGTNQWDDLSGYGNNGTVNGSPTTIQLQEVPFFKKDTFGLPMNMVRERGLMFDGDGYLKVDDDNSLDITSNGTWEFWLKLPPQGISADQFLLDKQVSYLIKVQSTHKVVFGSFQSSAARSTVYNNALVLDQWYHIAITFDSSTTDGFTFYIDGESVTISQGSGNMPAEALDVTTNPLHIGAKFNLNNEFVDGKLDDIKIYNRVLSAAEVKKNYRATKGKHTSTSNWSDDFSSSFI